VTDADRRTAATAPHADGAPAEHTDDALAPLAVLPLCFTAEAHALIDLLCALGMARAVTAGDDSFGELVAGHGRVMVHGARGSETGAAPGDTDLCLSTEESDRSAEALRAAGFPVDVWDETYGRQGLITLPGGESIALNERQRDLYGYRGHEAEAADPRLSVTAVLASADFDRDADWAGRLGFVAEDPGDQWFRALRGPAGAGILGLHRPGPGDRRSRPTGSEFGDSLQVRLGFETTEDLGELAARMAAAGHPARLVEEGEVRSVHLDAPGGRRIEIHPRPVA
jgi:hypothetical protein